jgi:DNA-binding CsgD family transcriptional regulator
VNATSLETKREIKGTDSEGGARALRTRTLAAELRQRFSFTHTETSVALLLTEGLTYAEVAGRLGVSYHTVHAHIKAIHAKAGVPSNVRLLALLRDIERA